MTILADDMKYYESDSPDSLGAGISIDLVSSAINQLFYLVDDAEAEVGSTKYRCIYVKNESLDILTAANVYVHGITPSPSTHLELGLGTAGMNLAEQTVPDEDTAPVGVSFITATQEGNLPIGDMSPSDFHAIWIKRVVSQNAVGTSNEIGRASCRERV